MYVAANGDELHSEFAGGAVLSFTDSTDATVTFDGTQEFSPGTGRFAEAHGTVDFGFGGDDRRHILFIGLTVEDLVSIA